MRKRKFRQFSNYVKILKLNNWYRQHRFHLTKYVLYLLDIFITIYCLRMWRILSAHIYRSYRNATARTLLCLCAPLLSVVFAYKFRRLTNIFASQSGTAYVYYIKGGSTTTVVSFNIWNGLQWWASRVFVCSVLLTWEYYNSNENILLCGRTTHESHIRATFVLLCARWQPTTHEFEYKMRARKNMRFLLELRRHQGSENRIYLLLRKRTLMFAACSHTLFFIHDHKFIYCVSVQKKILAGRWNFIWYIGYKRIKDIWIIRRCVCVCVENHWTE